ncbi:MAG: putative selenate ABC transporter substrate-binding protein [endosymbiont of Galathealinum brachiosum]|uniref:Selenate ABC transporter substrate-binding protein n=1 Tax=endosymbiont of Galathealinum brachiosum TaxID=2200906 RepID=A0A370DEY5_9GAMM|nr:MAG: putative selenate ABC transporter substrate-binding protein [endosymbiont of Galathealinum brachiosum]
MINNILRSFLVLFFIFFTITANANDRTLIFSAIPDQNQSQLNQRFTKIATYLSTTLNIPVKYVPVKSYAAAITAFRNNQVQLAWFGGLSGVRARSSVVDSEAIAQGKEDTEFVTYFIAHHSTGLKKSAQLPDSFAGKNFTFGSKGSTSGRLMPEFYLRERFKKSPSELFNRVGFSGNHSRTIALVQTGAYQLGAVNYKVWENELSNGKIDPEKVSIIWKTPSYPDYQWSVRGDIDTVWGKGFKNKIKNALLNMKDPALLEAFPRSAFISADNDDYLPILHTAKKIGLID